MTPAPLTLGFVPLLDCAPLVVAVEKGFAAAEGLELRLMRENSWATIRDRVMVGHCQAAHMLGPMPIASALGIGNFESDLIAPMALGWGGNAITVSSALWNAMHDHGAQAGADPRRQGEALHAVVLERERAAAAPLTFAMVYPFSCHHYQLRYWLAACGIDPDVQIRLVVIPPPFMVEALRSGQIDGFCVGEPWNTLAVEAGIAHIVLPTTAVWSRSPEKVLGMRADWAEKHPEETAALVRALYHASQWCDLEASRSELARLLARPEFVGEAAQVLESGLTGDLSLVRRGAPVRVPEFQGFARHESTFPWVSHALWFYTQMVRWRQMPSPTAAALAAGALRAQAAYRPDLYRAALAPLGIELPLTDVKTEGPDPARDAAGFFDARIFDPANIAEYLERDPTAV